MSSSIAPTPPAHAQDEPPTLGDHAGYPVYPMPTFLSLVATDLAATVRFFTSALDFGVMFVGPEVAGVPMLVHLRRCRYQDVLVRQGGSGTSGDGLTVTFAAVDAGAIDAIEARVRSVGATVVSAAADTPWNTHELTVADPDGHRFAFTARAATLEPGDFDARMREVASRLEA